MYLEVVLVLVSLLVYFIIKDRKPANMPPGPFEIPFVGRLPIFEAKEAEILRKKYGNIVTHRSGNIRSVFIYDYQMGKEAMAKIEFTGRPFFFQDFNFDDQKTGGVVGSVGKQWQHDRRFVLRNLRNLGMGKSYLEEAINIEAKALVEDLKKYNGMPINYPNSFRTAVLNIIWQMVASRRFDLRSKEVDAVYRATNDFRNRATTMVFLPTFVPVLRYFPKFLRNILFKEYLFDDFLQTTSELLDITLKEHEKKFNSDNPQDLIGEYLKFMEDQTEGPNSLLRLGALKAIIGDLFSAGSDTVNNMLKWVAFLLARYPDIAETLKKEVDGVVPRDKLVSLQDRPNLPYVDAFMVECLRYSSMVELNVQRTALTDVTVAGYRIPQDTVVTVSNYRIHNDPKYWTNPEKFSPDRFIDDNGKFQAPRDGFFAFGSGRRQCLGENLARMELFLFSAAIIQNFDILVPDGVTLNDKCHSALGLRIPQDKPLIYKARV